MGNPLINMWDEVLLVRPFSLDRFRDEYAWFRMNSDNDVRYVEQALEAGTSRYILKDNVNKLMGEVSQAMRSGQFYICKEIHEKLE